MPPSVLSPVSVKDDIPNGPKAPALPPPSSRMRGTCKWRGNKEGKKQKSPRVAPHRSRRNVSIRKVRKTTSSMLSHHPEYALRHNLQVLLRLIDHLFPPNPREKREKDHDKKRHRRRTRRRKRKRERKRRRQAKTDTASTAMQKNPKKERERTKSSTQSPRMLLL